MSAGVTTVLIKDGGRPDDHAIILQNDPSRRCCRRWFSPTPELLRNGCLPFFLRFPGSPPLVALAAFLAFFRQPTARQLEILAYGPNTGLPSFPCSAKRSISSRRLLPWLTDGQRRRLAGVGSERTADRTVRGEDQIRHQPGPERIAGVSAGSVPSLDRAVISITKT
jgi:hypothetical protein